MPDYAPSENHARAGDVRKRTLARTSDGAVSYGIATANTAQGGMSMICVRGPDGALELNNILVVKRVVNRKGDNDNE
ncbi:hypothetical protein [Butyrivibrio sp. WCD3002]|uniref:hypothetical protein n=1 Tax=Butyrivibrio sp. WCD3002 TaxID=1280676 RepID=UPI00041248C7|nr:hypothetical protein [Butyrivibrio sp. WCD3002]